MNRKILQLGLPGAGLVSASANAVYLNIDNIDVAIGPISTYTTSRNTFDGGATIDKVIDAPTDPICSVVPPPPPPAGVPEPGSLALLGLGLVALGLRRKQQR